MSGIYRWAKRHRGKLLGGTAIVGGLILAGKLLERQILKAQEEETKRLVEKTRKQAHFQTTDTTALNTFRQLYDSLLATLNEVMDPGKLKVQLSNPDITTQRKIEIWEEMKTLAFGKQIVYIVSSVYLAVLVRIEVSLLAGQLYTCSRDMESVFNNNNREKEKISIPSSVQEQYLSSCKYFVQEGLKMLIEDVKECITTSSLSTVTLQQPLDLTEVQSHLLSILDSLQSGHGVSGSSTAEASEPSSPAGSACTSHVPGGLFQDPGKYLIKGENGRNTDLPYLTNDEDDRELLKALLSDTLDILESEDIKSVVIRLSRHGLAHVMDRLTDFYSPQEQAQDCDDFVSPVNVKLPLVKLVPILCGFIPDQMDFSQNDQLNLDDHSDQEDQWFLHLKGNPELQILAANIYESYSQQQIDLSVRNDEPVRGSVSGASARHLAQNSASNSQESWYDYISSTVNRSISNFF